MSRFEFERDGKGKTVLQDVAQGQRAQYTLRGYLNDDNEPKNGKGKATLHAKAHPPVFADMGPDHWKALADELGFDPGTVLAVNRDPELFTAANLK